MPIQSEKRIIIIYADFSVVTQNNHNIKNTPLITEFLNFDIFPKNVVLLFLHVPNSLISEAIILMCVWSFKIKTSMVCVNKEKIESDFTNDQHDLILIGVRGTVYLLKPEFKIDSLIQNSKLPELVCQNIELMYPDALYFELNNKKNHNGWENLHFNNED